MSKPKKEKKESKKAREFMLLLCCLGLMWLGHASDDLVWTMGIFVLAYAFLGFLADLAPNKEKKDEVSEVRKQEGEGE